MQRAIVRVSCLGLWVACTPTDEALPNEDSAALVALPGDTPITTRAEVLRVLDTVLDRFRGPVATAHGARMVVEPDWERSAIGLAASATAEGLWVLRPAGGLATNQISQDAMQMIACHEVGHFLGGFPFSPYQSSSLATHKTILAAEGQADYYAAKDCLGRVWTDAAANAAYRARLPDALRAQCDETYATLAAQRLCYRIVAVGEAYARVLDASASLRTPSTVVARTTRLGHFAAQLRLDTIVAGALCTVKQPLATLPGVSPTISKGAPVSTGGRSRSQTVCLSRRPRAPARKLVCGGSSAAV